MNAMINKELRPGEQIVWEGKPEKLNLFEGKYAGFLLIRWIICALSFGGLAGYLNWAIGRGSFRTQDLAVVVLAWGLPTLLAFISPFRTKIQLETNTACYITNQRAITCYKKNGLLFTRSMELEDIPEISVESMNNGNGILYVGKRTFKAANSPRNYMTLPEQCKSNPNKVLVFYNIHDPYTACEHFPETVRKTLRVKRTARTGDSKRELVTEHN